MLRLAASLAACALSLTGCVSDQWFSANTLNGVPIATPDPPKLSADALQTAEKVQALGKRIIEQNTFTGLDPLFHSCDVVEPILFHRGPEELFISNGLVKRCKTEAQLAAVLCGELGRMMVEKRSAKAVGVDLESVHEVAKPSELLASGAVVSKDAAPVKDKAPSGEPLAEAAYARDLLRGAGFDPGELAKSGELLAGVKRSVGTKTGKPIAGPAPAPVWQK